MPDANAEVLAVLALLVATTTQVVKKALPRVFPKRQGERAVLLTAVVAAAYGLGAYHTGLLPVASNGEAVMAGLLFGWLGGTAVYAASKPMHPGDGP